MALLSILINCLKTISYSVTIIFSYMKFYEFTVAKDTLKFSYLLLQQLTFHIAVCVNIYEITLSLGQQF